MPSLKSVRLAIAPAGFLIILLSFSLIALAEKKPKNIEATIYRGGLRAGRGEHALNQKQMSRVLAALAAKTGFQELSFDEQGFLNLGNREHFSGGSSAARRLLMAAVDGHIQLSLEEHQDSKKVSFSRILPGIFFQRMTTQERIEVRPILIDFSDFNFLNGDRDVLASFDLGIVLLHELIHGVHGLQDTVDAEDAIGECETFTNSIRNELGLPERGRYEARSVTVSMPYGIPIKMASLPFTRTISKKGQIKTETTYLLWNTNIVGYVEAESITASNANKKEATKSAASVQ